MLGLIVALLLLYSILRDRAVSVQRSKSPWFWKWIDCFEIQELLSRFIVGGWWAQQKVAFFDVRNLLVVHARMLTVCRREMENMECIDKDLATVFFFGFLKGCFVKVFIHSGLGRVFGIFISRIRLPIHPWATLYNYNIMLVWEIQIGIANDWGDMNGWRDMNK